MTEKNCIDCKNLKAKIPIKKAVISAKTTYSVNPRHYQTIKPKTKNKSFGSLVIDYDNATVSCAAGMIVMEITGKEAKDRIFKNVLKIGKHYKNKTFKKIAEKCPYYESMEDE